MNNDAREAVNEILKSLAYLIEEKAVKQSTQNYDGVILSNDGNNKWSVKYNGEIHSLPHYGDFPPQIGKMVKVFIPQGNSSVAYFI